MKTDPTEPETKHTPGPWALVRKDEKTIYLCLTPEAEKSAQGTYGWYGTHKICLAGTGLNQEPLTDEGLANAYLFAAAPDLLAAITELLPAQEDFETCSGALEGELHNQEHGGGLVSQKTRQYFRDAKVRFLKAKDAARAAIARAKGAK